MMATLYGISVPAINQHIKKIYTDNELSEKATIKNYLIVQNEGKRQISKIIRNYTNDKQQHPLY